MPKKFKKLAPFRILIIVNKHLPMRKLTQPRRLRRIFGSQPIGSVAGSRCPEAGLEARVVLANRRVRLFTKDNGRLGDLATWRLGRG